MRKGICEACKTLKFQVELAKEDGEMLHNER